MKITRSQRVGEDLFCEDIEEELKVLYPENTKITNCESIGKKIGKLKILYCVDSKWSTIYWMCRCECGRYFIASNTFLSKESVPNCGCLKEKVKERKKKEKERPSFIFDGDFLMLSIPGSIQQKHGGPPSTKKLSSQQVSVNEKIKGSTGEKIIHKLLEDAGINFTREEIVTLSDNTKGRFDFFVEGKYFIEYDGAQHYKIVDKWSGEQGLLNRLHKDALKNEYCMNERIPLIRIPYTEKEITLDDLKLETTRYLFYNGEEIHPDDIYYLCHESENSVFSRVDFESSLL